MNKKALLAPFVVFLLGLLQVFSPCTDSFAEDLKKILSIEAYDMLNAVPDTYLIDVRTRAEYQFVGHPINAYLFPYMFMTDKFQKKDGDVGYRFDEINKKFVEEISALFKKSDNLLILCRDGTRSALAAKDLVKAGFEKVYDVEDGFEGPLFPTFADSNKNKFYRQLAKNYKIHGFDKRRHYGWQWWGLPWTYDMDPKYIYPPDQRPSKEK